MWKQVIFSGNKNVGLIEHFWMDIRDGWLRPVYPLRIVISDSFKFAFRLKVNIPQLLQRFLIRLPKSSFMRFQKAFGHCMQGLRVVFFDPLSVFFIKEKMLSKGLVLPVIGRVGGSIPTKSIFDDFRYFLGTTISMGFQSFHESRI